LRTLQTLGDMPGVVTVGEMPGGRNPWWETKVEIFIITPRSRKSWIGGDALPSIDHAGLEDLCQRLLLIIRVQPYSPSIW